MARRPRKAPVVTDLFGNPMPAARRRDEELIQKAIVEWWSLAGHRRADMLGIDVGAPAKGARFRKIAMGAVAGWPDLTVVLPDGRVGFLEVKTPEGDLNPAQERFRDRCAELGRPWALVRSIPDAEAVLRQWGALKVPGKQHDEAVP